MGIVYEFPDGERSSTHRTGYIRSTKGRFVKMGPEHEIGEDQIRIDGKRRGETRQGKIITGRIGDQNIRIHR